MGIPFLDDLFTPQLSKQQQQLMQTATTPAKTSVAPFDPLQTQGQETVLGVVPQQQDIANTAFDTNQFLLNDVLFPGTNPALQQTIDFATQPIMEKFTQDILPNIRGGAELTGQFGGSRRGNIETRAASDVERNIGGVTSALANEGYLSGLKAMLGGLATVPQTQSVLERPGLTQSGVGDVRQQQEQNKRNAKTANAAATAASAAQQFAMTPQTPSTASQILGLTSAIAPFFI
jgi:hypothetical protein